MKIFRRSLMATLLLSATLPLAASLHAANDDLGFDVVPITYAERFSGPLRADAYVPHGKGPFPGVLVVHGGGWIVGNRNHLRRQAKQLARRGYTALAINYRMAPEHKFPAQLEDCQAALAWMVRNAAQLKLDPTRIGGYGYSAGGHLVTLMGVIPEKLVTANLPQSGEATEDGQPEEGKTLTRLKAIVAGGAPCDFRIIPPSNRLLAYWLGGARQDQPELYRLASPAAFVSPDDPPVFFYHGENDWLVPIGSARQMERMLHSVGVTTEFFAVPGASHFKAFASLEAAHHATQFLDKHLKEAARKPAGD